MYAQFCLLHQISQYKILNEDEKVDEEKKCNCLNKVECPLQGNCLIKSIIYRGNVTTDNKNHENNYIGLVEPDFKGRERYHHYTFNKTDKETSTELSKYIWQLKRDESKNPKISYSVLEKSRPYKNGNKRCPLCLTEKYHIIFQPFKKLNKRNELISKCRHENKFYLRNGVK